MRDLSNVMPRYFEVPKNRSDLPFNSTENSRFAAVLVGWNTGDPVVVSLSLVSISIFGMTVIFLGKTTRAWCLEALRSCLTHTLSVREV